LNRPWRSPAWLGALQLPLKVAALVGWVHTAEALQLNGLDCSACGLLSSLRPPLLGQQWWL